MNSPSQPDLPHIYWLGGSPCSGKSTVSRQLAAEYGLTCYSVDDALGEQLKRLEPARHPALTGWLAKSWDERWLQPEDALLDEALACYGEHFSLVLEDVLALPAEPVIVEGCALLPALVQQAGAPIGRGFWLTPTAEFLKTHYARRGFMHGILAECSQPETAFANWMRRDARFAGWVAAEAQRCGYPVLWVDGSQAITATVQRIAAHFRLERAGC